MSGYPVLLQLVGMRCLVIGGGAVAERKILGLLKAGALVTVISPTLTEALRMQAQSKALVWLVRVYEPGDLTGFRLVFAATSVADVNARVAQEARQLQIFVNVVDHSGAGDFSLPAVWSDDLLSIAVATGGAGPATAKVIRDYLGACLPPRLPAYLSFLARSRQTLRDRGLSTEQRRQALLELQDKEALLAYLQGDPRAIQEWAKWFAEETEHNKVSD